MTFDQLLSQATAANGWASAQGSSSFLRFGHSKQKWEQNFLFFLKEQRNKMKIPMTTAKPKTKLHFESESMK